MDQRLRELERRWRPERDAPVLDQARRAVGAWALRGVLPERSS